MRVALLLATVFLFCDQPVASLQFDVDTIGTVSLEAGIQKQIATAPVAGKIRVIIYGLNQSTFSGRFAIVSGPVNGISGVVAAAPDGTAVTVTLSKIASPESLRSK